MEWEIVNVYKDVDGGKAFFCLQALLPLLAMGRGVFGGCASGEFGRVVGISVTCRQQLDLECDLGEYC